LIGHNIIEEFQIGESTTTTTSTTAANHNHNIEVYQPSYVATNESRQYDNIDAYTPTGK
jgi:hypothetical protein